MSVTAFPSVKRYRQLNEYGDLLYTRDSCAFVPSILVRFNFYNVEVQFPVAKFKLLIFLNVYRAFANVDARAC